MYILKMEYLERRGAAQDALFASGFPCRKYMLMAALATMIELVDINEATFKRYLLLQETQLTVASPPRFMLLIMTFRPPNNASHVSMPCSNVFILRTKWSGLSNVSSRESVSQESTLQLKLQKESKTYDVYSMVFSLRNLHSFGRSPKESHGTIIQ